MSNHTPLCRKCDGEYTRERWALGYKFCLPCGEEEARVERKSWCILTPHKQGAMFFTAEAGRELAKGINSKYTPV
jgi:hypothetical protein